MNIIGGMVVVLGDDPGANSSQNEQDNRHYARLSYTPVLEPADPGEVYAFYKEAATLSRAQQMPVVLRLTTHVCHAKAKVAFGGWRPSPADDTPRFDRANGPYIPIASAVFPMKRKALQRLGAAEAFGGKPSLNRRVAGEDARRGVVTMGLPFLSLMDVLEGAPKCPDVLKIGMVHPFPRKIVNDFLAAHAEVLVLEELDDLLETEIKALAYDRDIPVRIRGKTVDEDRVGEYTPDKVRGILSRTWPDLIPVDPAFPPLMPALPNRPAQMCPGCGHRSAFHAIKNALADTDITVADIGCHTLGFLPPYHMGELLMCMGASTGMAAGLSVFNQTRKVVAFLGDSTFFHAGLPGIINAVFNRHPITLILMENGTTAMTGHQDHAASGRNFNEVTERIPVRQVLEGLGVRHIFEADTYQQKQLAGLVKEAVALDEISVVIARHPCMLKFTREQRRRNDYRLRQVAIDQTACDRRHVCVAQFACPTFHRETDGTVHINPDLCIGDGSCLQTCPSAAIEKPAVVE